MTITETNGRTDLVYEGDDRQIIPVNFQKRHKEMLQWTYTLMSKRFIKIQSLQKLVVSLRTAVVIDDWKLDKQQTSHDDILDSFIPYATTSLQRTDTLDNFRI